MLVHLVEPPGSREDAFLAAIARGVPEGILLIDPASLEVVWANDEAGHLFGVDAAELVGRTTLELQHPDDAELSRLHQQARQEGGVEPSWQATRRLRQPDGSFRLVDGIAADCRDDPRLRGYVFVMRDASARHQAWETERRLRALVEHAQDAVLVYGRDLSVVYASPAAKELLDDLDGTLLDHIDRHLDREDAAKARGVYERILTETGANEEVLLCVRRTDGTANWVQIRATNLFDDPAVAGLVLNGRIVTEQVELEARLRDAARRDPLTGLPNRTEVLDHLTATVGTLAGDELVAVLFLDLDRFKVVNDSFGHGTGDRVLTELGVRLTEAVRLTGDERLAVAVGTSGMVGRFGGDEYVVVGRVDGREGAVTMAEVLARTASRPFAVEGPDGEHAEVYLSGSVGIAVGGPDADPSSLLHHADAAMYRAKERGRGTWELYDEGMRRAALTRLTLEAELAKALDDHGFELWFQPIVDVATGRVRAFEALARWRHRERGLVSPLEFIPIAEETGGIHRLGTWALATAAAQHRAWQSFGLGDLGLSVNLSPRQLGRDSLAGDIAALLEANGVPPEQVTLEITETLLMDDLDLAVKALCRLKDVGVRLALDDFGTGWSSLTYLRSVPIDSVKIDRTFIQGVATADDDRAIVAAVVAMCRALDKTVVAEGVELENQFRVLREVGCTHAQGYLFSRPLPAQEVPSWLERYLQAGNRSPDP